MELSAKICFISRGMLQMEMLFCSTVVGLPFLIPPMVLTGELFRAWNSCYEVTPRLSPLISAVGEEDELSVFFSCGREL